MARKALEMTIELGGRVSGTLGNAFSRASGNIDDLRNRSRSAQRELNRLGNEFRQGRITQTQYAEATERITREMRQLENAQKRVKAFSGTLTAGYNTSKAVGGIAALTAASATAVTAMTAMNSINTAADFETQMSAVKAKTQATGTEMKALEQTALQLGASTSLSASEVGGAMNELAAKGFDVGKIIGAMPGIIAGAEASGEDLALVSDVVTSAINSYGFAAEDAGKISDIMAMSANTTAAGVYDLGQSFKYAAPVAKTLGIKFEELSAATGILVDKGLAGEQAGTALRMSLIRLSDPPTEAAKALKKLNISAVDSNKNFKSLAQISGEWNKATEKLTATQKVQYASTVFGAEAATAMLNIFDAGPEKIQELTKALEESAGSSAEAAAIMKDNYAGAKNQMLGAAESAKIAFATPLLPVLQGAFNGVSEFIENNMDGIENLGQKAAKGLKAVIDPFAMSKPELTPEIKHDPDAFAQYQKELAQYTQYEQMDFSDKVIASLDTVVDGTEQWLAGGGGEAVSEIFSKLGEIAFDAWATAFTGALKASGSNLMEGNVGGALGMGAAAWMLGGGLMVKGAIGAGRLAKGLLPSRRGRAPTTPISSTTPTGSIENRRATTVAMGPSATGTIENRRATTMAMGPSPTGPIQNRNPVATTQTPSRGSRALSNTGKVVGKAALPVAVVSEVYNISNSDDKVKATAEAGAGMAGSIGGAKLGAIGGATLGSFVPIVGTAIGGAIGAAVGSIGGYFGGKWAGGKATDVVRGKEEVKATAAPPVTYTSGELQGPPAPPPKATAIQGSPTPQNNAHTEKFNTSVTDSTAAFTQLATATTTTSTTMTASMTALDEQTKLVTHNMSALVSWSGQASGWIATLNGIQPAGQRVITALNNLEQRINSVVLPGGAGGRTAYE